MSYLSNFSSDSHQSTENFAGRIVITVKGNCLLLTLNEFHLLFKCLCC